MADDPAGLGFPYQGFVRKLSQLRFGKLGECPRERRLMRQLFYLAPTANSQQASINRSCSINWLVVLRFNTALATMRVPSPPGLSQAVPSSPLNSMKRVYARLKDEFGISKVRVRGPAKVMAHLMFAVLALTADQLLRLA